MYIAFGSYDEQRDGIENSKYTIESTYGVFIITVRISMLHHLSYVKMTFEKHVAEDGKFSSSEDVFLFGERLTLNYF